MQIDSLSNLCNEVSYGYTASAIEKNTGIKFLRITDIQNGVVNWDSVPFCNIEERLIDKYLLNKNDIVVARTGNSTGENYLYKGDISTVFASYLIRFRIDSNKAFPAYVWWNMRTSNWWNFINNVKTGSAQAGANAKVLGQYPIKLPSYVQQKAIAHILGTLDDKIELNKKMNQALEDIAKTIFKSWFVDFDPVRLKIDGRPTGLPNEISELFPSKFVQSELGEIPNGWQLSQFSTLARIQNGYAFKSKDWDEYGEVPVVKIGNVKPMLVDVESCSRVKKHLVDGLERFKLSAGDVLIGMTGYVGEVGLVPNFGEMPYLNQRVGKLIPTNLEDYSYIVIMTRRSEFKVEVENLGTGSAQANVSAGDIEKIKLILPPSNIRLAFSNLIRPIIDKILTAHAEVNCLSKLRDTLLPKLISGELQISDAEKLLKEAGI